MINDTNFDDSNHALKAGMVVGALMKAGILAYPEPDEEGDYTPIISLRLDVGDPEPIDVQVKVLP